MRFKNVLYTHTDVFSDDEKVAKFIADFDIDEMRSSGMAVDDVDCLVIEVDVQEGIIHRPFISNLEDNTDVDTTDEEAEFIVDKFKEIILKGWHWPLIMVRCIYNKEKGEFKMVKAMTIAELIKELEKVPVDKRDLPIYTSSNKTSEQYLVTSVSVYDEDDEHNVENMLGINFDDLYEID